MSPITHGLLAWLLAVIFIEKLGDRRLICVAGVISDIDGFFTLYNKDLYYQYHHTFGHSFVFGVLVALAVGFLAKDKKKVTIVAFGAFTLHLIADIIGTHWEVYFFYPFTEHNLTIATYISDKIIYWVIKPIIFTLAIVAVIIIMYKHELSPVEFISDKLDKKMVGLFVYPIKYKCEICGRRSFLECKKCGKKVCSKHSSGIINSEDFD